MKNFKKPEIIITVVPGIVSMFTFASKIGVSIGEGAEKISVILSGKKIGSKLRYDGFSKRWKVF